MWDSARREMQGVWERWISLNDQGSQKEKNSEFVRAKGQGSEEDVHQICIQNGGTKQKYLALPFIGKRIFLSSVGFASMSQNLGEDLWNLAFSNVGRRDKSC